MTSEYLCAWRAKEAGKISCCLIPIPSRSSDKQKIAPEDLFGTFVTDGFTVSCQDDQSNKLLYAQTLMLGSPSSLQVCEISTEGSGTRSWRPLKNHGTTFSAFAFGVDLSDNAVVYAADPANSRLYQFGPPGGSGTEKTRTDRATAYYALPDPDRWKGNSIVDFLTRRLPQGGGGEELNMAYVLSGSDGNNTHLLITPLKQGDESSGVKYFDAPKIITCDKEAHQVVVDPQHKWAWVVSPNVLRLIDLQNTDNIHDTPGPWNSKLAFAYSGNDCYGVIASGSGVKCVPVDNGKEFWIVPAEGKGESASALQFPYVIENLVPGANGIVASPDNRAWTLGEWNAKDALHGWDLQSRAHAVYDISAPDFVFNNTLHYVRDGG
ncbi:hypothetical protein ACFVUW_11745 [Streptomyces xiamenensis]|uniref:hypothetical protein n=1 Tax=Streptomyces xiamenensis TaxID=408015 RepID=UPI0036E166BE